MLNSRLIFLTLTFLSMSFGAYCEEFIPPSAFQLNSIPIDEIKYNLKAKGAGLDYRELFNKLIAEEKMGFLGYHGDSLDFFIYQDIIRIVVEEIIGLSVRKDFHFISTPMKSKGSLESMEDLAKLFVKEKYLSQRVINHTFPLNVAIYANHNCSGLNTVVNFSRNSGDGSKRNRMDLSAFFEQLGLDPQQIEYLYAIGYQHLESNSGVILQFFDASETPYTFANTVAYGSYPNGFVAQNSQISELFFGHQDYPKELRFILHPATTLNPHCPLVIKRFIKCQPSKLKAWEQELRQIVQALPFNEKNRDEFKQFLECAWSSQ